MLSSGRTPAIAAPSSSGSVSRFVRPAVRTRCGHGSGREPAAASAAVAIAVAISARCAPTGPVLGCAASSVRKSSWATRSGSRRNRRTHRGSGHPTARAPRRSCAASTASATASTPLASANRSTRAARAGGGSSAVPPASP